MRATIRSTALFPLLWAAAVAADNAETGSAARAVIEEVVVTARKREESIQDVPLSLTAFSGKKLDEGGYTDVTSLARLTPNMEMETIDPGRSFTYIRGVGTRRFDSGVDQSVATFVDGLYRGRSYTTNTDLLMVERVEVLKGPQGTLYGKNTIGGAIAITTVDPRLDAWSGRLRYEMGVASDKDDEFRNATIFGTGPLVEDVLGIAIALSKRDFDGYETILDDNPPEGNPRQDVRGGAEDNTAAKIKLRWLLTDSLDLTLGLNYSDIDTPPAFYGLNDGGDPDAQPYLINPLLPRPQFTNDPRVLMADHSPLLLLLKAETWYGRLRWERDNINIQWISGIEATDFLWYNDIDGTGYDTVTQSVDEQARQQSQELRVDFDWGAWRLLLGAFYSDDNIERDETIRLGPDSIIALANFGNAAHLNFLSEYDARSLAAFTQLNVDITEYLELTAGFRQSRDRKSSHSRANNDLLLPEAVFSGIIEEYNLHLKNDWDSRDFLLSASWRLLDDTMIYATASTGYKSGGFQWIALTEENAARQLDPEYVDNYEVGIKSTLLQRRLRTNLAVFQMDYTDLQVLTYDTTGVIPVAVSENAAESQIKGLELEVRALLSDNWSLNLAYSYLDAVYEDYLQNPDDPSTQRAGNAMPRAPEHTASAGLEYETDLGGGSIQGGLRVSWKDSFFWEPDNNTPPRDQVEPELTLLDANIGYTYGAVTVNLWGKNLTDEVYRALVVDLGEGVISFDVFAPPRMVGLQLEIAF